ncbi:MAG: zinc ABC transporter substrate-binding protein [Bacilli bacterium]|nr:zinc ABC transporter substrate-binding protein [Bacilli bacterium]
MKKIKLFGLIIILMFICLISSGCTNDNMENIRVLVTNYPNEFITQRLYGNHSTVTSIYPDGVDITDYVISSKQKKDFSQYDLFIYNGLIEKERNLAVDLLDLNPNLKIIDTAYVLETDYSPEELWLNPSSLLMMAQNVRLGLEEYIDSNVLKTEIDAAYDELKVELSELDATYRIDVENTNKKTIVVANSALKYLEKFGLQVYCIDGDATDKTISTVQDLITSKQIQYIYSFVEEELNDNVKKLVDDNKGVSVVAVHKLDNINDEERKNKETYLSIMKNNLELIKKEIYK